MCGVSGPLCWDQGLHVCICVTLCSIILWTTKYIHQYQSILAQTIWNQLSDHQYEINSLIIFSSVTLPIMTWHLRSQGKDNSWHSWLGYNDLMEESVSGDFSGAYWEGVATGSGSFFEGDTSYLWVSAYLSGYSWFTSGEREVEFCIELQLGTTLISHAP